MRILTAIVITVLAALPARADAILGGTGIFKHSQRDAYLIYVDWAYVYDRDEDDDSASIVLFDVASGDSANIGARKAEAFSANGKLYERFTIKNGCVATIAHESEGMSLGFGNASDCHEYMVLAGRYAPTWLPPE